MSLVRVDASLHGFPRSALEKQPDRFLDALPVAVKDKVAAVALERYRALTEKLRELEGRARRHHVIGERDHVQYLGRNDGGRSRPRAGEGSRDVVAGQPRGGGRGARR